MEKNFTAHLIVIGDELLSGKISDINTYQVANWLMGLGIEFKSSTTTSDKKDEFLRVLKRAWRDADLIITTGGLGPTEDDITKEALGEFFGGELKINPKAQALAIEQYKRIEKDWDPQTNSYHLIPESMEPVPNPKGLAPGLCFRGKEVDEGKIFFAAPGVPRELKGMMEEEFTAILKETFPSLKKSTHVLTIRTFGVPEEKIFFQMMPNLWKEMSEWGKVSSLPQVLGVDIQLTVKGTEADFQKAKDHWKEKLMKSPLGETIWCWENSPLEVAVIREAKEKGLTLSLAESCTGGLVASRLTDISGSSDVFLSSVVAYANEAKVNILGVNKSTLEKFGAVSEETALEMAIGVRKVVPSHISASLTGIAGPNGGTAEKPVGTVCLGISSDRENKAKTYKFRGDREHLKRRFSEMALFKILEEIRKVY